MMRDRREMRSIAMVDSCCTVIVIMIVMSQHC
jgi:hypothetical protein